MSIMGERKMITFRWFCGFWRDSDPRSSVDLWLSLWWGLLSSCRALNNTFGKKDDSSNQMKLLVVPWDREGCSNQCRIKWLLKNKLDQLQETHQPKSTESWHKKKRRPQTLKRSSSIQTQISGLLEAIAAMRPSIFPPSPHSWMIYKQFLLFHTPKRWCDSTAHTHPPYSFRLGIHARRHVLRGRGGGIMLQLWVMSLGPNAYSPHAR